MQLDYDAKVIRYTGFVKSGQKIEGTTGPDDPNFQKRILCEGDSWFSLGGLPSGNLLDPLKFSQSTLLVNLAKSGDTIQLMSSMVDNPVLHGIIADAKFLTKWDAIFISGGGNDLIDWADRIICEPSSGAGESMIDYVNRIDLAAFKREIQDHYRTIAGWRDASPENASVPIVTHVYDYPTPRKAKAKVLGVGYGGPWLYRAFMQYRVPEKFWISITDYLFESLAEALIELSGSIKNFHVITGTREVLTRARLGTDGEDGDWLNEIHPTTAGYKKLAAVVSPALQVLLDKHPR